MRCAVEGYGDELKFTTSTMLVVGSQLLRTLASGLHWGETTTCRLVIQYDKECKCIRLDITVSTRAFEMCYRDDSSLVSSHPQGQRAAK